MAHYCTRLCQQWTFQYGPVIKLPHDIDQSATWLFWHNIFTSFLVNLLLNPIGMLIPWLKKSWITNPSFNYPKLRLRRRVGLFHLSLGRFGFCNSRLFKSWDYLNAIQYHGGLQTRKFGHINYPKLRLRHRVGLFNLSLGRFGFCNLQDFSSHGITSMLYSITEDSRQGSFAIFSKSFFYVKNQPNLLLLTYFVNFDF